MNEPMNINIATIKAPAKLTMPRKKPAWLTIEVFLQVTSPKFWEQNKYLLTTISLAEFLCEHIY